MAVNASDSVLHAALFGVAGGLVSAVTSHPLDTLKTRLQTGAGVGGMRGVRGLFRGMASPVVSVPPSWAANFLAYGLALRVTGDATTLQHTAAGALSGIVWGVCVAPFELIKCIAQHEQKSSRRVRAELLARSGGGGATAAKVFARGLEVTVLRDFIGVGLWFGGYHFAAHTLGAGAFVSGGVGGCACWLTVLPIDTWATVHRTSASGTTLAESFAAARAQLTGARGRAMVRRLLPVTLGRQFVAMGCSMTFVDFVKARTRSYQR